MDVPITPNTSHTTEPEEPLERYVGQPFPTADQAVLCCFGVELTGERTFEQLRRALQEAGFDGPLARYAINTSPLLRRGANRAYRIKNFSG